MKTSFDKAVGEQRSLEAKMKYVARVALAHGYIVNPWADIDAQVEAAQRIEKESDE